MPPQRTRVLRPLLLVLFLWLASSEFVVPGVIRALWESEALSHVEALEAAKEEKSLDRVVAEWRSLGRWATLGGLLLVSLALVTTERRWVRSIEASSTADDLGALRLCACGTAAVVAALENLPDSAVLPRELVRPMGVIELFRLIPGFDAMTASTVALTALQVATLAVLSAAALGWKTRWTVPAGALLYLVQGGILRQYCRFHHVGLIPLYVLIVLSFAPCGDGLSVDRWLRRRRGQAVARSDHPSPAYGWARWTCWAVVALPYSLGALMKLRRGGTDWWSAENLQAYFVRDALELGGGFDLGLAVVHWPDWLLSSGAVATLVLELALVLTLVSRRARKILPLGVLGLHGVIFLFQEFLFPGLMLLQLIFYDLGAVARGLVGRVTPPQDPSPSQGPAPEPGSGAWPRRARWVCGVLIVAWAFRLELYPLTAVQMYSSSDRSGIVEYYIALAHEADGSVRPIAFEDCLPSLGHGCYRWALRRTFTQKGRIAGERVLQTAARRNLSAGHPPWTAVEIQRRRWNFRQHPDDAAHGAVVETITIPIEGQ